MLLGSTRALSARAKEFEFYPVGNKASQGLKKSE